MATFTHNGREIYYEERGKGEPLLVLNGIFMSCASWAAFTSSFSRSNRLLLLDMLDQGKSARMEEEYTQDAQVDVALAFLRHLGLDKVHIMGISYGGEVAIKFAVRHPEMVDKLVLANTAAHTSSWLRDIGHSWEYAYKSYDGHQFFKTCIPIVYSPKFYENNYDWISAREELFVKMFTPDVYDAFGRLTRSSENHDERAGLGKITAKTLVISSEYDYVTPVFQQTELAEKIPDAGHMVIQDAGHALMYEKPAEFTAAVLGFINSDITMKTIG